MGGAIDDLKLDMAIAHAFSGRDRMHRGSCLTHALLNGAYASEIDSTIPTRDNPYERGSDWRWAWYTGFDLGQRINRLIRQRNALMEIIDALDPHVPPNAMVPMDALFELMDVNDELKAGKS